MKNSEIEKNQRLVKYIVTYWKKLDNEKSSREVVGNLRGFRNVNNKNEKLYKELTYLIDFAKFILNNR